MKKEDGKPEKQLNLKGCADSFVAGKRIGPLEILKIQNNYSRILEHAMVILRDLAFDKGRIVKCPKLDLPLVYLQGYCQNFELLVGLPVFDKPLLIL